MALCFAVRRGEIEQRLDPFYNSPEHRELDAELAASPFDVRSMGDQEVIKEIIEGRITPTAQHYSSESTDPAFVRAQNIREGYINYKEARRLTKEAFYSEPKAILEVGDVVLTIDGVLLGMAAAHVVDEVPCCVSNHMVRIRHGSKVVPQFLALYLNSPLGQQQIKRGITGSAIPGLRTHAIKRIMVSLPPPDMQSTLVAKMRATQETYGEKLAEADALFESFDAYLLSMLGLTAVTGQDQAAFAARLKQVRSSRRINPQYFHPERISAVQAIRNASKNLEPRALGSIAIFRRDVVSADASDNYIGLANVQSNTGELIETADRPSGTCFKFSENEVLFARLRPYLNKVHRAERSGVCSTEFHVIRVLEEEGAGDAVLPGYLSCILRSSIILAQVRHMMTGNTHPRLTNEDVVNLIIPVPEASLQREVVAEMHKRREESRKLKAEAQASWEEAKVVFERKLLKGENEQ